MKEAGRAIFIPVIPTQLSHVLDAVHRDTLLNSTEAEAALFIRYQAKDIEGAGTGSSRMAKQWGWFRQGGLRRVGHAEAEAEAATPWRWECCASHPAFSYAAATSVRLNRGGAVGLTNKRKSPKQWGAPSHVQMFMAQSSNGSPVVSIVALEGPHRCQRAAMTKWERAACPFPVLCIIERRKGG